MNRSATEGARSSRHHGDEGGIHPPLAPRCVRTARSGRARRDPRRSHRMLGVQGASGEGRSKSRAGEKDRRRPVRSRRTARYQKRGQDNPRDLGRGGGRLRGRPSAKGLGRERTPESKAMTRTSSSSTEKPLWQRPRRLANWLNPDGQRKVHPYPRRLEAAVAQDCEHAPVSPVAAKWGPAPETIRRMDRRVLRRWAATGRGRPGPTRAWTSCSSGSSRS